MLKVRDLGINVIPAGDPASDRHPLYLMWTDCGDKGCTTCVSPDTTCSMEKEKKKEDDKSRKNERKAGAFNGDSVTLLKRQLNRRLRGEA